MFSLILSRFYLSSCFLIYFFYPFGIRPEKFPHLTYYRSIHVLPRIDCYIYLRVLGYQDVTDSADIWKALSSGGRDAHRKTSMLGSQNSLLNFLHKSVGFKAVSIFLQTYRCGKEFALVTLACLGTYAAFTLLVTQWR